MTELRVDWSRYREAAERTQRLEHERDWFRRMWASAQGCTEEEAQRAYERGVNALATKEAR